MSGWEAVGGALGRLFGGGDRDRAVYQDQLGRNASLEQKLATANRERMKSMALDAVLNDESIPQQQRNILAAELGSQFSGLQQGLLHGQTYGFRDEAAAAARAGDWNALNPMLAVIDGKALKTNTIEGGGRFVGNTYDTDAGLGTTEFGNADIARVNAATGASAALADQRAAAAALTRAKTDRPELYGASPKGASPDGGPSPDDVLDVVAMNEAIRAENRRLTREGKPTLPEVPLDGLVRGFMAPPATPAPLRATNPQTGEVLELRGGQWVKAQ